MHAWLVTLPPRPSDWPVTGGGDAHPPDRFAKAWKADGARMNETLVLTPERILEVTEEVLRRYGLAKATVVDVARALDVSHGSVYRHFPSKASLREAVAKRWLDRVNAPLSQIAQGSELAPAKLERWVRALCTVKQKKVCEDPEMFQTYLTLARE